MSVDTKRTKVVTIYKSGRSLVIRLPSKLVEDWGLKPGMHIVIRWDYKRAEITKIE